MLVSNSLQFSQVAVQSLLPVCELRSSSVVGSEEACRTVHDEQRIPRIAENCRRLKEKLLLVLCIVRTSIGDILQHILAVQTKALGNVYQSFRSKSALSVYVEGLAFCTTLIYRQLACDTEGVAKLCLSTAELAEDL